MKALLIVEGVTGAGKSQFIAAFREAAKAYHPMPILAVIDEDRTLGSIMDDVQDEAWRRNPTYPALDKSLAEIERLAAGDDAIVLVERFHLTAFALHPDWRPLEPYDRRLAALGAMTVLLTYPSSEIVVRSLDRPDRETWAEEMSAYYGSREKAASAVDLSQRRRQDALALSALEAIRVDTSEKEWPRYAAAVMAKLYRR